VRSKRVWALGRVDERKGAGEEREVGGVPKKNSTGGEKTLTGTHATWEGVKKKEGGEESKKKKKWEGVESSRVGPQKTQIKNGSIPQGE